MSCAVTQSVLVHHETVYITSRSSSAFVCIIFYLQYLMQHSVVSRLMEHCKSYPILPSSYQWIGLHFFCIGPMLSRVAASVVRFVFELWDGTFALARKVNPTPVDCDMACILNLSRLLMIVMWSLGTTSHTWCIWCYAISSVRWKTVPRGLGEKMEDWVGRLHQEGGRLRRQFCAIKDLERREIAKGEEEHRDAIMQTSWTKSQSEICRRQKRSPRMRLGERSMRVWEGRHYASIMSKRRMLLPWLLRCLLPRSAAIDVMVGWWRSNDGCEKIGDEWCINGWDGRNFIVFYM